MFHASLLILIDILVDISDSATDALHFSNWQYNPEEKCTVNVETETYIFVIFARFITDKWKKISTSKMSITAQISIITCGNIFTCIPLLGLRYFLNCFASNTWLQLLTMEIWKTRKQRLRVLGVVSLLHQHIRNDYILSVCIHSLYYLADFLRKQLFYSRIL